MDNKELKERIEKALNNFWVKDVLSDIRAILADLEDVPKPTGEQLKAIGKVLDGDAPRECKDGDCVWLEEKRDGVLLFGCNCIGKIRWHLKDAPSQPAPDATALQDFIDALYSAGWKAPNDAQHQKIKAVFAQIVEIKQPAPEQPKPVASSPCVYCRLNPRSLGLPCMLCGEPPDYSKFQPYAPADMPLELKDDLPPQPTQMICKYWRECKMEDGECPHKEKHNVNPECRQVYCSVFPDAVCVPWVEPVVHYRCDGCVHEKERKVIGCGANCIGEHMIRRNWTPKEPEPATKPDHHNFSSRPCSTCGWMVDGLCGCTIECHGDQWKSKEPKAEPGLVSYEIFKFHDEWTVKHPDYVNKLALNQAVGRTDFLRIDCKNGGRYYSLIAFANENPPVKCWFRETK